MKPSLTRSACICFSVRRCLRGLPISVFSQPASFSEKGSSLLGRSGAANFGSIVFAARCFDTVLRERPVRRAISRIDSFSRKCMRRMMFKSPMWITPLPPPLTVMGEGSHGSLLSGNYALTRLSSGWKSTPHQAHKPTYALFVHLVAVFGLTRPHWGPGPCNCADARSSDGRQGKACRGTARRSTAVSHVAATGSRAMANARFWSVSPCGIW